MYFTFVLTTMKRNCKHKVKQMLQILKPEVKLLIDTDVVLKAKIAKLFEKKSTVTVDRWIEKNSPVLTIPQVLDTIREHARENGGLAIDAELLAPAA